MKKLTALAIAVAMFTLTGCTGDEMRFADVLQSMSNAEYYEMDSTVSYRVNYTGTDEFFGNKVRRREQVLTGATTNVKSAYEQDPATGASKAHYQYNVSVDPVTVEFESWVDYDLTDGKYNMIAAIPDMAKAMLPEEYAKDYVSIDYIEMMDEKALPVSVEGMETVAQNMREDLPGFMESFGFASALEGNVSVSSGTTRNGGEVLTLTMNNEQLKAFLIDYMDELKTSSSTQAQYYTLYSTVTTMGLDPRLITPEFIEVFVPDLGTHIEGVTSEVEKFLEDTTILGREGIVYEVVLDEDGNVESATTVLDILIDAGVFAYKNLGAEYGYKPDQETINPDGHVEVTITTTSVYSNYNAGGEVTIPELSDRNSANVVDVIRAEE